MYMWCTAQGGFTGVSKARAALSVAILRARMVQHHSVSVKRVFVQMWRWVCGSHSLRTNDGLTGDWPGQAAPDVDTLLSVGRREIGCASINLIESPPPLS